MNTKLASPLGIVGTLGVAAVGGSVAGIILASSGGSPSTPTPVTVQHVAEVATDSPTPAASPVVSPTDLAPVQSPTVTQETVKAAPVQAPAAQTSAPPAPPVYTPPVVVDSQGRRCAVDSTGSVSVVDGVCSAY